MALGIITFIIMLPSVSLAAPDSDWVEFKKHFLQSDGRIIDNGSKISHTEGQGVAMLLAVRYDDRASFDTIWSWTRTTLQIRQDKLLAWRWSPKDGVSDKNNATDGDLYVAWSLLRAQAKWKDSTYGRDAQQILTSVREKLLRQDKRGMILLPGANGFEKTEGITVNLSYWLFPALKEFDQAFPDPIWEQISQTGITLLREGHFGRWGLPPDWMKLNDKLEPATDFPARFSYDAVRIPLYLLWAGRETPELMKPFHDYWGHFKGARFMPAWTNLNDDSIDSWDASTGIRSVAQIALNAPNISAAQLPALDASQDYYSATLLLLGKAMLAEHNR